MGIFDKIFGSLNSKNKTDNKNEPSVQESMHRIVGNGIAGRLVDETDDPAFNAEKFESGPLEKMLKETINPSTERVNSVRINAFINKFFDEESEKSDKDKKPEEFFSEMEHNIMATAIGFAAYRHEKEIAERMIKVYCDRAGGSEDDRTVFKLRNSPLSFPEFRLLVFQKARENKKTESEINKIKTALDECFKDTENKYDMSAVIDNVMNFEGKMDAFDGVPKWYSPMIPYSFLKFQPERTRKTAILSVKDKVKKKG